MGNVEETASKLARFGEDYGGGTAYLLVVDSDTSSTFALPRTGTIVVGRAAECDLRVQHASVSRRHATVRVDDGVVRIADLGSHNGTRVNGEPVAESRTLASGDVATVGDVVLVVHFSAPAPVARAAYGEAQWRRRLAEELERAMTFKRMLGVVAVLDAGRNAVTALGGGVRLIDVVGTGDDGQALILLPEVDRDQARTLAEQAIAAIPGARGGLAMCPSDAVDADSIPLAARSAARRAEPGCVAQAAEAATWIELGERRVLVADPAMMKLFALLERIAPSGLPVLITGETGVGKENAAYAVHHWSHRGGPFLPVNCAAIGPESLVDSELFGHEKGAFTGATAAKAGLFESAAGGTVFLDEVGELPLAIQAKLLRALEVKKITRLGDSRERTIDVRLVAATNRKLETEVQLGRFREDLFFRLTGATVPLPPLRDRRCEIPVLAHAFLAQACQRSGRGAMRISPQAMQVLLSHSWPGNVRELRNTMEYVMAAAPDDTVEAYDLPEKLGGSLTAPAPSPEPAPVELSADARTAFRPLHEELADLEKRRMSEALAAAGGVKTRAAQLIDMPIRTFTFKLKQYKL